MADPAWQQQFRIATSLGYPHPDLLFEQLTPEQAFELRAYAAMEPFGEVRMDLRFAHILSSYFSANSKKGTRLPPLGAFTLYPDLVSAAQERADNDALQSQLAMFATKGKAA